LNPGAVAIFEGMCRRHPDLVAGVRRTLERRVAAALVLVGRQPRIGFDPIRSGGGKPGLRSRDGRARV